MNNTEKNCLDTFKKLLLQRIDIISLTLFGSCARGESVPYSDIDVLVIVPERNRSTEDIISESAWTAGFEHGIVIAPIVYSRHEWEETPERYSLLAQVIVQEGVTF